MRYQPFSRRGTDRNRVEGQWTMPHIIADGLTAICRIFLTSSQPHKIRLLIEIRQTIAGFCLDPRYEIQLQGARDARSNWHYVFQLDVTFPVKPRVRSNETGSDPVSRAFDAGRNDAQG